MAEDSVLTKILITDDDEDDFFITSEIIKKIPLSNFKIDWCYNFDEALIKMKNKEYDLYFVDYRLGTKTGVELLKEATAAGCDDPIILLTGKGNIKIDIEAMQTGATDYLIKTELTTEKLERSLRYALDRASYLKALKASERKYRRIFENSRDVVFIADHELNILDINSQSEELFGFETAELIGNNLLNFIDKAQHKKYLVHTLATTKEINDWEVSLVNKDGDQSICIMTATVEDLTTNAPFIQGIIHDISNLRKAEKISLQIEKLAVAGRLVRTLAHEVRNPLNNITLSVEQLLQEEQKNESDRLYLDIINRNAHRINALIGELLNTSKPTDIVLKECVFQSLVDAVIATTIDRMTLKNIKLTLTVPDEPMIILVDYEKVKIALTNIVVNAIEAMEDTVGQLSVSLHATNEYSILRIEDNGCGISEENISRLYEPYFTQKRNGVGLGLSFTFNILQSHKASIDVTSKVGVGSTFIISFPNRFE